MEPHYIKGDLTLYAGDCREVMKGIPDNSVDSICCDPPYELNFMQAAHDRTGIAYDVHVWRECLRVLKPGGHLLAFGAPRTNHRMVCAIEDAGFQIRDSIMWIQSQGFPKSHNISKAIDRKLGRERDQVAVPRGIQDGLYNDDNWQPTGFMDGPDPISPEAKQWDGWGSALKPAFEPVVVARKPLAEKTIVDNVLKYGTGAINIDATRVGTSGGTRDPGIDSRNPESVTAYGHGLNGRSSEPVPGLGRYPSNVLLNHLPDCQVVGTKTAKGVKGGEISYPDIRGDRYNDATERISADVVEIPDAEVDAFACADGCPVSEMDHQSGHSRSTKAVMGPGISVEGTTAMNGCSNAGEFSSERGFNDEGGASRFFKTFTYDSTECALYGMLSVCERVRSAGSLSRQPDQQQGSAPSPVSERQSLNSGGKPDSSATPVSTVGESGKTTPVTIESTAQEVVVKKSKEQNALNALCAANLCVSCATAIVQSTVATMPDHSKIQMLGLPSTHAYNERILIQSLVWLAESLGNLGTTLTMTEYMKLFGCAADAISTYITMASQLDSKRSAQRSPSPMEASIDSSVRWKYNAKAASKERPSYVNDEGVTIKHQTVKPVSVLQWLVRLVTPPGGIVLDPFAGSGSTGEACHREGFKHIAIEITESYLPLIMTRWEGLNAD